MKRGRYPEDLQDTCDSKRKRAAFATIKRRMPRRCRPAPNFWSPEKEKLFLHEIIKARHFEGQFHLFPLWNEDCYKVLLHNLEIEDDDFKFIRATDLMSKVSAIRNRTTVHFYYSEVPVDEHDQLIYYAFHEEVKAAPLGCPERSASARNLGVQNAGVTVNLNSQRTSSHTTNIGSNSGSGSFSNATEEARERSTFLFEFMDELNQKDSSAYSKLLHGGNIGVIETHHDKLEREAFLDAMVAYSRALQ